MPAMRRRDYPLGQAITRSGSHGPVQRPLRLLGLDALAFGAPAFITFIQMSTITIG